VIDITQYAKGLAALVGARTGGTLPGFLADQVAGIIDVGELYLLNSRDYTQPPTLLAPVVGANVLADGVGENQRAVVPPGEIWWVHMAQVAVQPAAGEACRIAPGVIIDGSPIGMCLAPYQSAAAGENLRVPISAPLWLGPGSTLCVLCQSLTLQPDIVYTAVITRLRV
jgi:hypothetical protein